MANTINTIVRSAIRAAESYTDHVAALRLALPASALVDRAACMAALQAPVAAYYGIALEIKSTGRVVWPADHENTAAAKKAQQRLASAVIGETSNRAEREEIEVPEELLAAARKLAKLAQQYEGARSLANKALAVAFAK